MYTSVGETCEIWGVVELFALLSLWAVLDVGSQIIPSPGWAVSQKVTPKQISMKAILIFLSDRDPCGGSLYPHLCPLLSFTQAVHAHFWSLRIPVRWVKLKAAACGHSNPRDTFRLLLRLVAWKMKWVNLRGGKRVWRGIGRREEQQVVDHGGSQSCVIFPCCPGTDEQGT